MRNDSFEKSLSSSLNNDRILLGKPENKTHVIFNPRVLIIEGHSKSVKKFNAWFVRSSFNWHGRLSSWTQQDPISRQSVSKNIIVIPNMIFKIHWNNFSNNRTRSQNQSISNETSIVWSHPVTHQPQKYLSFFALSY